MRSSQRLPQCWKKIANVIEESEILEIAVVEQEDLLGDDDDEVSHSPLCVSLHVKFFILHYIS